MKEEHNRASKEGGEEKPERKEKGKKKSGGGGGTKHTCKNCGRSGDPKKGFHKDDDCWELEANAASRPTNWVSIKKE